MAPEAGPRRRWATLLGYALAAAALLFVARHLQLDRGELAAAIEQIGPGKFLLSCALFVAHLSMNATAFVYLSRAMGISARASRLAGAWAGSLLAKYVPGSIWQVVGRGVLLSRDGVTARQSFIGGLIEQGMSLAICTTIGILALGWNTEWRWAAALGALMIYATPLVFRLWPFRGIQLRELVGAQLGYSLAMLPFALGYAILLMPADIARFAASLFIGVVAGFLAVFVPGGLGVRESIFALLSTQGVSSGGDLLAGLLLARTAILLAECIVAAAGQALLAHARHRP
jgi:hypothetical protein